MIQLPNGCSCGEFLIRPKNWKQSNASVKTDWYIRYRFYDPKFKNEHPDGYPRLAKGGINRLKTAVARRAAMELLIKTEMEALNEGFNFFTRITTLPAEITYEIKPTTPFAKALKASYERLAVPKVTKYSIKSCLKYVTKAIEQLRFNFLEIQAVRRRHIKLILEQCEKNQARWSPQSFNHYRAYLMMMFKELIDLETVELNPVSLIEKKPVKRLQRTELTSKEREQVDAHLAKVDPRFRLYMYIFFHSGSRIAELARVRGRDVDMNNQRFLISVEKRKVPVEVWKPMKNLVYQYWAEMITGCGPDDYVFSHDIKPGKVSALPEYFTKRWKRVVKEPLNITADLYSLKHSNMEETAKIINIKRAQHMASHTSEATSKLYAQGEKAREDEDLKLINNEFIKKQG